MSISISRSQVIAYAVLVVALAVAPLAIQPVFVMTALCFALFACSCNLLVGYTGLLSFGHAAYFGLGSYVAAWVASRLGWTPELTLLTATMAGVVVGAFFGWLAIKQSGIYFSMIT